MNQAYRRPWYRGERDIGHPLTMLLLVPDLIAGAEKLGMVPPPRKIRRGRRMDCL